jgi:hypothetical protein
LKPPETDGSRAKVLAAAFRTWTTVDNDPEPPVVRIEIRYPPHWAFASTNNLTVRPGHSTPERAAAVIHGLLAEVVAAGRTCITTADLADAAPRIGRSRTWIAAHVTDLIDNGTLGETRRPDTFRIN